MTSSAKKAGISEGPAKVKKKLKSIIIIIVIITKIKVITIADSPWSKFKTHTNLNSNPVKQF